MKEIKSVKMLEEFGRIRLSKSFFMRDFLYSEISQIEGIPNIPDNPELAIRTGTKLCEEVLEPIADRFGRISIRSAYRSPAVNAKGAENKNQYNCSSNEHSFADHIWDYPEANGTTGATACIIVNAFIPYYEQTGQWQALAWWIHDHIPSYSTQYYFPKMAVFNIGWHDKPEKWIKSHIPGSLGTLTNAEMGNFSGNHDDEYQAMLETIKPI